MTPDYDLSLESYVQVQEGEFEIYDLPGLVAEGKRVIEERNSRLFTENATEKGASITVISLSDYLPGGRANLMIFRDQRAEFDARSEKVLKILQSKDKTIEDLRNSVKKAQDSQEQSTLELQRV